MGNNAVGSLRRDFQEIKGAVSSESTLRPVWSLYSDSGEFLKKVTMDGQSCEDETDRDIFFSTTQRMWDLLNSGARFTIAHGGRSSLKSWSFSQWLLSKAVTGQERFLCAREVQVSIRDSVKQLLENHIAKQPLLAGFFESLQDRILGENGSVFLFRGLRDLGVTALQSMEGLTGCWIEESQTVTRYSWDRLTPTVREEGSRILCSLNPRRSDDYIYSEFVEPFDPGPLAAVDKFTFCQNPWCPSTIKIEAEDMSRRDPARYEHIYAGGLETYNDAAVFQNWSVLPEDFNLQNILDRRIAQIKIDHYAPARDRHSKYVLAKQRIETDKYVGLDFGYGVDPSAVVLVYRDPVARELFVLDEYYEMKKLPSEFAKDLKEFLLRNDIEDWTISADSARPDLIDEFRMTYRIRNIRGCKKTRIKDGIDLLKNWTIFIDRKCKNTIKEFGLYRYMTRSDGTIVPEPIDKNNHLIDSIRYACVDYLTPYWTQTKPMKKKSIGRF